MRGAGVNAGFAILKFAAGVLVGLPIAFVAGLVLGDVKKAAYVAQLWPSALRPPHVRSVDHKLGLSERLLVVCNGACDEVRR
jgi:hypothetical protein